MRGHGRRLLHDNLDQINRIRGVRSDLLLNKYISKLQKTECVDGSDAGCRKKVYRMII